MSRRTKSVYSGLHWGSQYCIGSGQLPIGLPLVAVHESSGSGRHDGCGSSVGAEIILQTLHLVQLVELGYTVDWHIRRIGLL